MQSRLICTPRQPMIGRPLHVWQFALDTLAPAAQLRVVSYLRAGLLGKKRQRRPKAALSSVNQVSNR